MALPWLQRVELAFFAVAFLCGAVAAVALTRTQVRLRVGADHRVGISASGETRTCEASLKLIVFCNYRLFPDPSGHCSFFPQGSFSGSCPLYGVATLNGSSLALSRPSAPSLCYFVAGVSGLLALYCLLLLFFWVYSSCIEDSHRGPIGLRIALAISTVAIFLVLVSACIVRFGTSSLCKSIISQNITSCSDAQKTPWRPPGTALQFYSNLHNAETSSWVNLVLWCVVLVLQVVQWKSEATPHQPLERRDPVWSSETDALVGPRLSHS
ncbi:transmembrane protein 179B isoform X3 [Hippopotamus amphibius kiboko]|uniref:transmembrane protein 179B isoform X3 n=1 Tax=Hippopotamus amphibius kiboko TaxID=575201 RepID=UPI002595AE13|nr:transmembrane protein 179B isoform X3 [Hippopotamus amphibius kiboko]